MDHSEWTNDRAVVRESEPSLSLPVPPCRSLLVDASDGRRHRDSDDPSSRPREIQTNTPSPNR